MLWVTDYSDYYFVQEMLSNLDENESAGMLLGCKTFLRKNSTFSYSPTPLQVLNNVCKKEIKLFLSFVASFHQLSII